MKAQILHSLRSPLQDKERKEPALAIILDIMKATIKEQVLEETTSVTIIEVEPQQQPSSPKRI